MPSAKVCKVFQTFYSDSFGKQLYFSNGIAAVFWGRYFKLQPLLCGSSCRNADFYLRMQVNKPYHEEFTLPLPTPCSSLFSPFPASLCGCRVCPGHGLPFHCITTALTVMDLVVADGCFCENSVTQSQCQLRKKPGECV